MNVINYYFLFLIILFLITLIIIKFKGIEYVKNDKKYLIFIFLLLTFFLAFKSENVGVDADSYRDIFYDISKLSFLKVYSYDRYEIGYKYLCKLISFIWNNYQFFLFIIAFIEMFGFYYFIKKYSKNYALSLFIFITFETYMLTFGVLRQAIALSISLFAFKYIDEKKILKFILTILIASLFHKTAAIFLLAYPLQYLKINKKSMFLFTAFLTMVILFGKEIVLFIMKYIYMPSTPTFNGGHGYKMILLLYLICMFSYMYNTKLIYQDKKNNILLPMIMLGTLIQCLAPTYKNTGRLVIYFFPFIDIVIPNICEIINNKKLKLILIVIMIFSLSIFFFIRTENLLYEIFL